MIDLDDFKKINDQGGHLVGDRVLRETAVAIRKNIRRYDEPMVARGAEIDIVSRYGGEEFIIIQPDTPLPGGLVCAERLRRMLEALFAPRPGLPADADLPGRVTGSFGVTAFHEGETVEAMIKRADTAMYQAKEQGKNRVIAL
jgi:diguanylate cyclase (GGDEF)-like protein